MKIIKKHWNNFYKKNRLVSTPTNFAKFCLNYLNKDEVIYDAGCGNGRDVVFFNKSKIKCFGVDSSKTAIDINKKKFKKIKNRFIKANFCKYNYGKYLKNTFSIYSRFAFHAINKKDEDLLIKNLSKKKKLNYLFIETRTIYDDFYGKGIKIGKDQFIHDHYRRFIKPQVLKKKIEKRFNILYFKISKNFAKFKNENPCVLRIIAKKK